MKPQPLTKEKIAFNSDEFPKQDRCVFVEDVASAIAWLKENFRHRYRHIAKFIPIADYGFTKEEFFKDFDKYVVDEAFSGALEEK